MPRREGAAGVDEEVRVSADDAAVAQLVDHSRGLRKSHATTLLRRPNRPVKPLRTPL
jgi:hypothetical protein